MISCKNSHPNQPSSTSSRRGIIQRIIKTTALSPFLALQTYPSKSSPPINQQSLQLQYDSYAQNYDQLDGGAAADALGFPDLRSELIHKQAKGDTLEIAVGTGLNLPFYDTHQLSSFTAIDLSPGMLAEAQKKASQLGFFDSHISNTSTSFQQADVVHLPFQDSSFDTVVDTFSLCVFSDPLSALNSIARVVKPKQEGGRVLLLEHTKSINNPLLAWYQDVTAETVASLGKGCYWNQDVSMMLRKVGLHEIERKEFLGGLLASIVAEKVS